MAAGEQLGTGTTVFVTAPVHGTWRMLHTPDDVLDLMDTGAEGVVAGVQDAGATFLAPIFDELTAVVCLSGTPLSHIGIVSREYQVPCLMSTTFTTGPGDGVPADGTEVTVDCSTDPGAIFTVMSGADRDAVNETLLYHGAISGAMTAERTALESALIPVTAYILISGIETYRRYPEMMDAISAARSAADLGADGRRPGNQIDAVHLWSIANIPLVGRQVMAPFGLIQPEGDLATLATIFDFWRPAAAAFRDDGHLQAWDAGFTVPRYGPDVLAELVDGATPLDDTTRTALGRANAALTSYLFLLYFDTRAGYQDTGLYPLADGRRVLVRDFNEMGVSHFPWSAAIAADLPYANLTLAFVMDGVRGTVNDWGTSVMDPVDYLAHTQAVGVYESTGGTLRPVPLTELVDLKAAVTKAQRALYRLIAGMSRKEKIDVGAYVYFTFLRPFARMAGVEDALDWTIPRDSLDVYEALSMIDKVPDTAFAEDVPYYTPLP